MLTVLTLKEPYTLRDPDNFTPADPLATSVHIQPEYFLFAYAILRSIPNKLGGVIALVMSIAILFYHQHIDHSSLFFLPTRISGGGSIARGSIMQQEKMGG